MFKRRKLFWQLYPSYLITTIIALLLIGLFATDTFREMYLKQTESELESKAMLFNSLLSTLKSDSGQANTELFCRQIADKISNRITVVLPDGKIFCDSDMQPLNMDNHRSRPEIIAAMQGKTGISVRRSSTLNQDMIYVAYPALENGTISKIIRLSIPVIQINKSLSSMYLRLLFIGIILSLIVTVINYILANKFNKMATDLKIGVQNFALGNFKYQVSIPNSEEMALIAEGINQMAAQLQKVEDLRRDFIANVSHELKTPITAIGGFIETLKKDRLIDRDNALHFLDIIDKHIKRMNLIIDDLLNLSKIERDFEGKGIVFEEHSIRDTIISAISACRQKAKTKNIEINFYCSDEIIARINPILIEQALINLIDNAIKYSENNAKIAVDAFRESKELLIKVSDSGCGISPEHLPRIFERFYRVDKSRSRSLGGTGLGLAIVKHIVQAHGGRILVDSELNKGSIFTIFLPL